MNAYHYQSFMLGLSEDYEIYISGNGRAISNLKNIARHLAE